MIDCYWCGASMSDEELDTHIPLAHPERVSPMSPTHVEAIATHRGAYDLTPEEGS